MLIGRGVRTLPVLLYQRGIQALARVSQNFPNYTYVFSLDLFNVLDYSTTQKYEVWTSKATVHIALLPLNLAQI